MTTSTASNNHMIRDIGSRLELFADDWLIERQEHLERRLHHPMPAEVALNFDQPWEGPSCCYVTVFQDEGRYRMYYACFPLGEFSGVNQFTAYAESLDGISWTRPSLDLIDFKGSTANNLVLCGQESHNFSPFIDGNPAAAPKQRYKAVGGAPPYAFASADGIHWNQLGDAPLLPSDGPAYERVGIAYWDASNPSLGRAAFDSHNLAFWDPNLGEYVYYFRGWFQDPKQTERAIIRSFYRSRSDDFLNWSDPEVVEFSEPLTLENQFYTNCVQPYPGAPHTYIALPNRYSNRAPLSSMPRAKGLSEAEFMFSRDGCRFLRFMEPFVRPGTDPLDWAKHNLMMAWGTLGLSPAEFSLYATRHHYAPTAHLQRFVLRSDGFISLHASHKGGEFTTKALRFSGSRLQLNIATGITGSLRIEIQDELGRRIEGYGLAESEEFYGDSIAHTAAWSAGSDLIRLAGTPVRLRFLMRDADLYALQFVDGGR